MSCAHCGKNIETGAECCPHCGKQNPAAGLFQTSAVLISAEGTEQVYRSVDEVPPRLRNRLLRSTSGANSETILIADRKGRHEITKVMRKLPGSVQRQLMHSLPGTHDSADPQGWLTPSRRKWIAAVVLLLALAVVVFVFLHRWN